MILLFHSSRVVSMDTAVHSKRERPTPFPPSENKQPPLARTYPRISTSYRPACEGRDDDCRWHTLLARVLVAQSGRASASGMSRAQCHRFEPRPTRIFSSVAYHFPFTE